MRFAEYFNGQVRDFYDGIKNNIAGHQNNDHDALLPETED